MESPFLNIFIEGNDISTFVEKFQYEDSMDKDNMISVTFKPEFSAMILEESYFQVGARVKFRFGYITKQQSSTHNAIIQDIKSDYGKQGINVSYTALDLGHIIKKTTNTKIWKNKTSFEIAKSIASKYGFRFFGNVTTKSYQSYPQANLSDFELLQKLASLEYDYVFFLRNNELHFEKRGLDNNADILLEWGKDDFVSFKPKQTMSKSDGSNVTTSVDETSSTKSDLDNNLNKRQYSYDINAENNNAINTKKNIVIPTEDDIESSNISRTHTRNSELNINESTIKIVGNPVVKSKMIVTISNVATRYKGNWQINTVRHIINQGGYITMLDLKTDGTNFKSSKTTDSENGNTSIGDSDIQETKQVYEYDVDGNRK